MRNVQSIPQANWLDLDRDNVMNITADHLSQWRFSPSCPPESSVVLSAPLCPAPLRAFSQARVSQLSRVDAVLLYSPTLTH